MSRLRTTLASTETDKQVQRHLDRASREVEEALRTVSELRMGGYEQRRTTKDLHHVIDALRSVRDVGEPTRDLDRIPESERNRQHRERLAQERVERRARKAEEMTSGG